MTNQETIAKLIKEVIDSMMARVMKKVLEEDPFIKEEHHVRKPLYAALVPDEIFKGSHFERRFVTPFGGVWERLAQVVAKAVHGECKVGYSVDGCIAEGRLQRIQEVLNKLEHSPKGEKKVVPSWEEELEYIKQGRGNLIPVSVVCDLYVENTENKQTVCL